jgi:hypothetical protein
MVTIFKFGTEGVPKAFQGIVEFFRGTENKRELGRSLLSIAELLEKAGKKLDERKIPKKESREILYLINFARKYSDRIKGERPDLAYIFEEAIPQVGHLLRRADFFIDKKAHSSIESLTRVYAINDGSAVVNWNAIPEAQEAIEGAVGALRGAAFALGVRGADGLRVSEPKEPPDKPSEG